MIEITEISPWKKPKEYTLQIKVKKKQNKKNQYNNDTTEKQFIKRQEVTIEMYNNLQNAFNNMDSEMTVFTEKNKRDQQEITTEIIHIIKNIMICIEVENKKLKNNLETAHKKVDDLNSLILVMSMQNKNKLCEHKNWVDNKMDKINNSISTLVKNIKKTDYKTKHVLTKASQTRLPQP